MFVYLGSSWSTVTYSPVTVLVAFSMLLSPALCYSLSLQDKFLHNNCLAALANMSASIRNIHPFAAQRLFGYAVFESSSLWVRCLVKELVFVCSHC